MDHLLERLRGAEMANADGGELGGVVLTMSRAADEIEALRAALRRYGDRMQMSRAPVELQEAIDRAMAQNEKQD